MSKIPTEIGVNGGAFGEAARPVFNERRYCSMEARMATIMIEKWGMIAGVPDGEDSSGRAKLRPLDPAELVERACDVAEAAVAAYERRGWFIEVPSLEELQKMADKNRGRN